MAKRRAVIAPDILKAPPSNPFAVTEQASQQDALPVKQQDSMPVSQHDSETASQQAGKPAPEPPIKATFYLDPATLARLDMARATLRAMLPPERRAAINLSAIVGAALTIALQELQEHGQESQLASMMVRQHDSSVD